MMSDELKYYCDSQRHLVCVPYSVENLHRMADDLGIVRSWFHRAASYPHYDIPKKRVAEVSARCTVVSPREILKIVKGGQMDNPEPKNEQIVEVHLNLHGRVLFSAISSWLLGRKPDVKIRGTKKQVETLARTMSSLRDFQNELNKPGADLRTVKRKLGIKNAHIKEFEKVFDMKWPSQL